MRNFSMASIGAKLGGKQKDINKDTSVGNVPPHSHDSSQNNNTMKTIGNITGNANQNSKISEIGKKFFQGDEFANQYASKPPVDPAMPVPPQPDLMNDQYGNMFMQPFAQTQKVFKDAGEFMRPKPNNYKYKKGDLIDETDHEESTYRSSNEGTISGKRYNVQNISDIQEDEQGQFMTTLGEGEYFGGPKPTSSKVTNYDQGRNAVRDTLRPHKGKVFISTWQKNK